MLGFKYLNLVLQIGNFRPKIGDFSIIIVKNGDVLQLGMGPLMGPKIGVGKSLYHMNSKEILLKKTVHASIVVNENNLLLF